MATKIAEPSGQLANSDPVSREEPRELAVARIGVATGVQQKSERGELSALGLPADEEKLLREAILSLKSVSYGSVVLVMHDGHLVEVSKTVRIRTPRSSTLRRES